MLNRKCVNCGAVLSASDEYCPYCASFVGRADTVVEEKRDETPYTVNSSQSGSDYSGTYEKNIRAGNDYYYGHQDPRQSYNGYQGMPQNASYGSNQGGPQSQSRLQNQNNGVGQRLPAPMRTARGKLMPSRWVAVLLAFFLGSVGAECFYLGKIGSGLVSVLFFWTGIPAIIGLVRSICWAFLGDQEWERRAYHHRL